MSVSAYGTFAFAAQRSTDSFRATRGELAQLQSQLSTGKVATTFSGLGAGAGASLALRKEMAGIADSQAAIADGRLRAELMSGSLAQIGKLSASLVTSLSGLGSTAAVGATSAAVSARHGLEAMLDALNIDLDGRYLFAGRASDTKPTLSAELILDGDAGRAGLSTLIAERKAADAGPDGRGRLTLSASGTSVSLAETPGLPFGFKIAAATATGTAATVAFSAGPPASAAANVAAQPVAGDRIDIRLRLPDGSEETIGLVAGSQVPAGATGYAIGADAAATAANIASALGSALAGLAATALPSASAMKTASDFFAADAANPPARIVGPPFETATGLVPGTAANTVVWYRGETTASPRETAPVQIGGGRSAAIGATANEPAFRTALAAFAALAADSFPAGPNTQARYEAMRGRIVTLVGAADGAPNAADVATDIALASAAMKAASDDLTMRKNQAADALASIEDADPTETAAKLLATQTRLAATYQTTALLQRLTLVDYL